MIPDGASVARCEACGDAIPVKSSQSDDIRPIRPGESCECGAEEFRLLSEAEVDALSDDVAAGRGT